MSHTPPAVCIVAKDTNLSASEEGGGWKSGVSGALPEEPQDALLFPERSPDIRARGCLPGKLVGTQSPGFLLRASHMGTCVCQDQNPDS